MNYTALPPVQRAEHIFNIWDLGPAIQILIQQNPSMTQRHADAMAVEYRRYLQLWTTFPHLKLPISQKVEPIWQAHLLYTEDYAAMCREAGVPFIHHRPHPIKPRAADGTDIYRQTLIPLYRSQFGAPPPEFWPTDNAASCD